MAKPAELGKPAEFKYQRVKYYPFGNEPADALLLTADPWSFLYAWLVQSQPSKGKRRACFSRARYYANLAEGFYSAAEKTALPTQGTLAYYGMLNLAKCFISVRGVELEQTYEHHGLYLSQGEKRKIQVQSPNSKTLNIFHEFANALGKSVTASSTVTLKELCSHLPEIHEIAYSLDLLEWSKRKFLPVEIHFMVNSEHKWAFTEISYEKKSVARVTSVNFNKGEKKSYFKEGENNTNGVVYRSIRRKRVNNKNWPRIYRNFCAEYKKFDLVTLLTPSSYKYYSDLKPGPFHHLSYFLMLLFYVGTVARYRPTEAEELMESPYRPLITEAVAISPKQFLYQVVSYTTKKVCVVPHARL